MAKLGRHPVRFDWDLVNSLIGEDCSMDYICEKLIEQDQKEFNKTTLASKRQLLERRIRERFDMIFVEYKDKKLEPLRRSLRRTQIECAIKDKNITMLIWLGKQMLGQTDVEKSDMKKLVAEVCDLKQDFQILKLVK